MNSKDESGTHSGKLWGVLRIGWYALIAALIGYLGWTVVKDWESIRHLDFSPSAPRLALAALFGFAGFLGGPAIWMWMLRRVSGGGLSVGWFHVRLWLQANFFRYVPGKVLVAVERVRLGTKVGIPVSTNLALMVWETVLIVFGAAALILIGLLANLADVTAIPVPAWALAAAMVVFLPAFPLAVSLASRLTWWNGFLGPLRDLRLTFLDQIGLILLYGMVWAFLTASFLLVCGMFVPLPSEHLHVIGFWYVVSFVVGFFFFVTPAGLGVREGVIVLGVGTLLPPGEAAAMAIIGRLWMMFIEGVCLGLAVLIKMPADPAGSPDP